MIPCDSVIRAQAEIHSPVLGASLVPVPVWRPWDTPAPSRTAEDVA
jgi:hypothetical protein